MYTLHIILTVVILLFVFFKFKGGRTIVCMDGTRMSVNSNNDDDNNNNNNNNNNNFRKCSEQFYDRKLGTTASEIMYVKPFTCVAENVLCIFLHGY